MPACDFVIDDTTIPKPMTQILSHCRASSDPLQGPRTSQWLYHSIWLLLPAAAIGLSLVLEIRDSRQVLLPIVNQPLPELCSFRRMTGLDCAGCGLTRSFISIGHGRLVDAWHYHPAGILLYAIAAFQLPWQSVQLWRLSRGWPEMRVGKAANGVFFVLAVLLLGIWILRIWGQIVGFSLPGL